MRRVGYKATAALLALGLMLGACEVDDDPTNTTSPDVGTTLPGLTTTTTIPGLTTTTTEGG